MTELAEVKGMIEALLRRQAKWEAVIMRLVNSRKPLTRYQFAEATGVSYRTICRKIWKGEIVEKDGRIPAKYLDAYLT